MNRILTLPLHLIAYAVMACLLACRPNPSDALFDPADPQATVKRLRAHLRRHPDDDRAWRDLAHVYWLHLGDSKQALPILDRLASRGDPLARLSRMVIAEGRDDAKTVRTQGFAVVERLASADIAAQNDFDVAAAQVAIDLADDFHGELGDDDRAWTHLYQRLDRRRLPYVVRQPLISVRAAIAREHGDDYEPYYHEQGCIQTWQVSRLAGKYGDLELARRPEAFTADPSSDARSLACVVRVSNPEPRAAIRRLRTFIDVPTNTLDLDLAAEHAAVMYLDGRVLVRTDALDRYPANRLRTRVHVEPGVHELQIATRVTPRAWVMVRAMDARGQPVRAVVDPPRRTAPAWTGKRTAIARDWTKPVAPIESALYEPLRRWMGAYAALADGDTDLAEMHAEALGSYNRFAEGAWLRSQFERRDPTRDSSASATREQAALELALEVDPAMNRARLRYYELMLARRDESDVIEALEHLDPKLLRTIDGELLRHRLYVAKGNEFLAERALARARRLNPASCKVALAQRSVAQDRDDVAGEDRAIKALERCPGTLKLRARWAEGRGKYELATKLWKDALERVPDDFEAIEVLARVLATSGSAEQAAEALRRGLALNPMRLGLHVALADLAAYGGNLDGARGELGRALDKLPHSHELHQAIADFGRDDELRRWRVDGLAALADYRKSGVDYPGVNEVLVLDRSVSRIYENGGQRVIVHLIAHLLSKESLDNYGEVDFPPNAQLLTLRTVKPSGDVLEPEVVPGKDGVSLRDLEIGDVVEYEFVVEQEPNYVLDGYVDVSSFRFQSQDVPYHRSELIVVHPPEIEVLTDARNDPPKEHTERIEIEGKPLVVRSWRADRMPRVGLEPHPRALMEEVPNVRVYTALDLRAWLTNLGGHIRYAQRTNPALRKLAKRIVRGHEGRRERVGALWRWVVTNVHDAGEIGTPATATLSARRGNRLMLLRAMLRTVGIDSQIWLARSAFGPAPLKGGHPLLETYDTPMLAVAMDDSDAPLMVTTSSEVIPLGYLPPGFARSNALRLQLDPREPEPGAVELPGNPKSLADLRRYRVRFDLDPSGKGQVSGTIVLHGMEAIIWRQGLRELDRDRIEEVFLQAELGWLGGATLDDLEIHNEKVLGRPLVLQFRASVTQFGVVQGGVLEVRAAPMPLGRGEAFTALPARKMGLLIPYAPRIEADVEFAIKGGKVTGVPPAIEIESKSGGFERKTVASGASSLKLAYRSWLKPGVYEPKEYPRLTEFVQKVAAAERAVVQVAGARSGRSR